MNINLIGDTILDESSSAAELRDTLDLFSQWCSDITGIQPDRSFDAWAEDSLLENGVAINPQAAAHCTVDYQRSVVFIRGAHAALNTLRHRFPNVPLEILYAGCGPCATLLLPLLGRFAPGALKISLLDIHQRSLDSVELLLAEFGYQDHGARTIKGDACHYQHPKNLHLVVAETMQKALEQEPQFAVTANLAPQLCSGGVFLPQRIDVVMGMADTANEAPLFSQQQIDGKNPQKNADRLYLAKLCSLSAEHAPEQMRSAQYSEKTRKFELAPTIIDIPSATEISGLEPTLFTRITVFEQYRLEDFESEITLPLRCHELGSLCGRERLRVSYQLGNYPRFNVEILNREQATSSPP